MRTIAHISDLHFGREDPAVARALLAELRLQNPDLVALSGDLTQRAQHDEFAAARDFIRAIKAPLIAVPGNHDMPLYDVARRVLRPLKRFRRYISDLRHPAFIDDELAVFGISTARATSFSNGRVSHDQMDLIRTFFAGVPATALRAVVMHHPVAPPLAAPERETVGRAGLAFAAMVEAGVELLLSGHYHRAASATIVSTDPAGSHPVLMSQAGTAISTRRRDEVNSYHLLRVEGRRITCHQRCWNGSQFVTHHAPVFVLGQAAQPRG